MTVIGHLFDGSAGWEQRIGVSQLLDRLPGDRYGQEVATLGPTARAVLDDPLYNRGDRRQYLRTRLRFAAGQLRASTPSKQGSHMLTSMLDVNGFILLQSEQRNEPGDEVDVQIFGRIC